MIDIKFLRHLDFRFRGYLLKKQMVFNDEAIKYFYELLEKLLLGNKEEEINDCRIKNFELSITNIFSKKQRAKKTVAIIELPFGLC